MWLASITVSKQIRLHDKNTKVGSNAFNATVQGQKEFEELREDDGMVDL